jgi:hypothetical protein
MREFQTDTSAVWAQRQRLLDEIRKTASGLTDLAEAAAAQDPAEPDLLEALEQKTRAETQPRGSKRGAVESAAPAVEAQDSTAAAGLNRQPGELGRGAGGCR